MLGHPEQFHNVIGSVHRVAAVHRDTLAGEGAQMVVKDLRVLLFLTGGEGKHRLQHRELLTFAQSPGKGVAVPGLALAGKGPHQIFHRLAAGKFHRHERSSL